MPEVARTVYEMISGMMPKLREEIYVFITTKDPTLVSTLASKAISVFREDEGISMILPVEVAEKSMLSVTKPMRCITLNVFSSLDGVGFTAAVSVALADNDIPCNMVAAFHHDHVFVPIEMSERAMEVLHSLQDRPTRGNLSDA